MLGSLAYGVFDARIHYRPDLALDPRLPLILCFDFNVDPLCCICVQTVPGPEVRVIVSVIRYNATTAIVVNEVAERFGTWLPGYDVYGDATGAARSVHSNESNYDVIRKRLEQTGAAVRMHVPAANPAVALRLNSMNAMLLNARGDVRLFIKRHEPRKTCVNRDLVRSLQRTTCKPGTKEILKTQGETWTHPGEALGYYIAREFPSKTPSASATVIKVGRRASMADLPRPAQLDRETLKLAEDVMRYGADAVIRIRRFTDPTFRLPDHLKHIAPGGSV